MHGIYHDSSVSQPKLIVLFSYILNVAGILPVSESGVSGSKPSNKTDTANEKVTGSEEVSSKFQLNGLEVYIHVLKVNILDFVASSITHITCP